MPGETAKTIEQDAPRPTLGALFSRLIEEGGAFLRAEILLYRAQATKKAFSAGLIVALIGGAIMLTQAALIVILVGLVMVLSPALGTGWAVLVVTVLTFVLIAVCVLVARAKIATLLKPQEPS